MSLCLLEIHHRENMLRLVKTVFGYSEKYSINLFIKYIWFGPCNALISEASFKIVLACSEQLLDKIAPCSTCLLFCNKTNIDINKYSNSSGKLSETQDCMQK